MSKINQRLKINVILLFLLQFTAFYSLAEDDLSNLNLAVLTTTGPCKVYVEEACIIPSNSINKNIKFGGGINVLKAISVFLKSMKISKAEMIEYNYTNRNECLDVDNNKLNVKSINYTAAKPQSINAEFLISWSDDSNNINGSCIELKVIYDSKKGFEPLKYKTKDGTEKLASSCGKTFYRAFQNIYSEVQFMCKEIHQVDKVLKKPLN